MSLPANQDLLKLFSAFLGEAGLSAISSKNYLSDLRHFLAFCTHIDNNKVISTEEIFQNITKYVNLYSENQKVNFTPTNTVNRRLASIRRFSTFLNSSFNIKETGIEHNASSSNSDKVLKTKSGSYSFSSLSNDDPYKKVINQYRSYLEKNKKSHSTVKNYVSDVNHFITWSANQTPFLKQDLENIVSQQQLSAYNTYEKLSHTSTSVINRRLSSIKKFAQFCFENNYLPSNPFERKVSVVRLAPLAWLERLSKKNNGTNHPENKDRFIKIRTLYQRYNSYRFTPYLHLAILVLATSAMAIFAYNQIISSVFPSQAATPPVVPNRMLSFQGRLTDSSSNPITSGVNVIFRLYDQLTGGTELYTSNACPVLPDQNGIFSTNIGNGTCGAAIPATVFSNNRDVFVEIQVVSETLTPRQQIATVGYALNSDTLQGYPASATATVNTVPVMNGDGNIVLAQLNPSIVATGSTGTFTVRGQTLSLQTTVGSGGNIILQPDTAGAGNVQVLTSGATGDQLRIANANLTTGTLISGYSGNNNDAPGLLVLSSGATEAEKFAVRADGQTRITTDSTLTNAALMVNQVGTGDIFTASQSGANKFVINNSGYVGVGTSSPSNLLTVDGRANFEGTVYIDYSTHDYSGTAGGGIAFEQASENVAGFMGFYYNADPLKILVGSGSDNVVAIGNLTNSTKQFDSSAQTNPTLRLYSATDPDINNTEWGSLSFIGNGSGGGYFDITNGTGDIAFRPSNNVGIGLTNPSYDLDVVGDINLTGALRDNGSAGTSGQILSTTGTGVQWIDVSAVGGVWQRNLGALSPLYITDSVNLGATATTSATVHLAGTSGENSFINTGNLGVGTTSPGSKLEVSGTTGLRIRGTGTNTNVIDLIPGVASSFDRLDFKAVNSNRGIAFQLNPNGTSTQSKLSLANAASSSVFGSVFMEVNGTVAYFSPQSVGGGTPVTTLQFGKGTSVSDEWSNILITNGNVGIGTIAPRATLDIEGNASASGTLSFRGTTDPKINVLNGENFGIRTSPRGDTGLTERMTILNNGNVGIGVTNPSHKFHVSDSTLGDNTGLAYFTGSISGSNTAGLYIRNYSVGTDDDRIGLYWQHENVGNVRMWMGDDLYLYSNTSTPTSNTNGRRIIQEDASGDVGIGITNASYKLDVVGDINLTGALRDNGSAGTSGQILSSTGTGVQWIDPSAGGGPSYWQWNTGVLSPTSITDAINLGNTATNSATVHLAGVANDNSFVNNGGNFGIGLTNPATALEVHRASQSDITISTDANLGAANSTGIYFTSDYDGTPATAGIGQFNTSDLKLSAVGNLVTPDMTILSSNGNVGIGVTNPAVALEIGGTGNVRIGGLTASMPVKTDASKNLVSAAINLASADVTGILPLTNGGTNKNMTAVNGGVVWTDADSMEVTAAGTAGQVLTSNGAAAPTWTSIANYWQRNAGVLSPFYITDDLAIGGTATSSAKFQVFADTGNATTSGNLTVGYNQDIRSAYGPLRLSYKSGANTWGTALTVKDTTGYVGIGTTTPSTTLNVVGHSKFQSSGNAVDIYDLSNNPRGTWNVRTGGGFYFQDYSGIGWSTGLAQYQGSVGIGTTTPGSKLSVIGGLSVGSSTYNIASPSNGAIIEGSVGIGTSNPSSFKLQVAGHVGPDAHNTYDLGSSGVTWRNIYGQGIYGTTIYQGGNTLDSQYIQLQAATPGTAQTGHMNVSGTGIFGTSVGIGLTNPGTTLDVTGTGRFSSTLTASSNFTLSAGALNMTATSGALSISGLGASTISTTANNLTLSTVTSGTLALTSAGALNHTQGASSTWTLNSAVNALNIDSNTLTIDSSNDRVGIGITNPAQKLVVAGNISPSATNTYDLGSGSSDTWRRLWLANGIYNSAGVGTVLFGSPNTLSGGPWVVDALFTVDNGTGNPIELNSATGEITVDGGAGKINVGTVDPPYTINGAKYSTYLPGMIGVKEEVAGKLTTSEYVDGVGYRTVLDLTHQPEGSDLWVFAKTTDLDVNINQLSILLTAQSQARTWYEINNTTKILAVYSSAPTDISYRMTAPRFDAHKWETYSPNRKFPGLIVNIADTPVDPNGTILPQYLAEITRVSENVFAITTNGKQNLEQGSFLQLLAANFKAGIAVVTEVIAENITISGKLISPLAEIDTLATKQFTSEEATISGILYADNIQGSTVTNLSSQISVLGEQYSTASAILAELQAKYNNYNSLVTATDSGDILAYNPSLTPSATAPADLALNFLHVSTMISNDVQINGALVANSLNSINSDLYIQPDASRPVHLLGNLMALLPTGQVIINGDLLISGTLYASAIDTNSATISGQLAIGGTETATASADKLIAIYGNDGNLISSVDASGSADFNQVATSELVIAAGSTAIDSSTSATTNSNASIGIAIMPANQTEVFIPNTKIDGTTLVYLTPVSDTQNQVLFVKSKADNSGFTVGINQAVTQSIQFNYWLVRTK